MTAAKKYIETILIITILTAFTTSIQIQCNFGVPVLVRSFAKPNASDTYRVYYQCLCPENYYGSKCEVRRNVHCIMRSVNPILKLDQPPKLDEKGLFNFTDDLSLECYKQGDKLVQENSNQTTALEDYKLKQPMRLEQYAKWRNQTQHTNIYDKKRMEKIVLPFGAKQQDVHLPRWEYIQILWINDTQKFNSKGRLIMDKLSNQTSEQFDIREQQQLSKYLPYKGFAYQYLLGYQMAHQILYFKLRSFQFLHGRSYNLTIDSIVQKNNKNNTQNVRLLQIPNIPDIPDFDPDKFRLPEQKGRVPPTYFTVKAKVNLTNTNQNNIVRLELSVLSKHQRLIIKLDNSSLTVDSEQFISISSAQWKVLKAYNESSAIYNGGRYFFKVRTMTFILGAIAFVAICACCLITCARWRKKVKQNQKYGDFTAEED